MWGLILGIVIVAIAIGLRVDGKVGDVAFVSLLFFALAVGVVIVKVNVTRWFRVGPKGIELETFRKDVNSIKEEALEETRKEVAVLKEAVSSVVEKANKTREDLLKVAEEAAPPYLSLESTQIEQTEEGYNVTLRFDPSKNAPFGTLVFRAEIIGDSEAIFKQLTRGGMHFSSKEQVSADGKTAIKIYASPAVQQEKVILVVSAPCKVRISGNYLQEPLELEVK